MQENSREVDNRRMGTPQLTKEYLLIMWASEILRALQHDHLVYSASSVLEKNSHFRYP